MVTPRASTVLLLDVLNEVMRYDIVNHIVETWERGQLTTTITEDLIATYKGDNEGLATFIEESLGDEDQVREALTEIGILGQ